MQGHAQGFTIIEVTIFLAISGLLLMAMFLGTGTMAARQRFKDSTDNAQTFFQAQYDEVLNGVNVRTSSASCSADGALTAPGKSQCLLLGKLMTLRAPDGLADRSTAQVSYIISTQQLADYGAGPQEKLRNARLSVISDGQKMYELKWGATFSETTRSTPLYMGTGRGSVNSVAFIRLPDSDNIQLLYYQNTLGYTTGDGGYLTTALRDAITNDTDAYSPAADATGASLVVCLKNDRDFTIIRPRSAIVFGQGQGAGAITTNYEPGNLCLL